MKKILLSVLFLASISLSPNPAASEVSSPLQTESNKKRGASAPPNQGKHTIRGRTDDAPSEMDFRTDRRGKEIATLTLKGDGSTDLDCVVIEYTGDGTAEFGANDYSSSGDCWLEWAYEGDRRYDLRVINQGTEPNTFTYKIALR